MDYVIRTTGVVGPDRVLNVSIPTDFPPGDVRVTVKVEDSSAPAIQTLGDLLDSGLLGMWTDRDDLPSTNEEFLEWRRGLWERRAS